MWILVKYKRKTIFIILIVILICTIWRSVISSYCEFLVTNNTHNLGLCYNLFPLDTKMYNTYNSLNTRNNSELLNLNTTPTPLDKRSITEMNDSHIRPDEETTYDGLTLCPAHTPSLTEKLWRDDGRCGRSYPLPNGKPGQCDPTAIEAGPCCSSFGYCGNTDHHCKCESCVSYAEKLWRDDGRCGKSYPLPNGEPGQCDPTANQSQAEPCCSKNGYCGNTGKHCECSSCVSYAGKISINLSPPTWTDMNRNLDAISYGGKYSPPNCRPRDSVAIVVPYRDRPDQLRTFINHIHPFLMKQHIQYQIFVVIQAGPATFNKARTMNAGFLEAMKLKDWKCFIFHDVDLLPENDRNLYTCPDQPRHLGILVNKFKYKPVVKLDKYFFGGAGAFRTEHFKLLNGYSNRFWGWGKEDDEMTMRIKYHGLKFTRHQNWKEISRYTMLEHARDNLNKENPKNKQILKEYKKKPKYDKDGLSTLTYQLVGVFPEKLYTNITVIHN